MKLPPFGKYLSTLIKNKQPPNNDVYLFIGEHAWDKAFAFNEIRPTTLCLPHGDPSDCYKWPVENCDVLVFDTSYSEEIYVENTAFCLLKAGANIVRYLSLDNDLFIYKKDF